MTSPDRFTVIDDIDKVLQDPAGDQAALQLLVDGPVEAETAAVDEPQLDYCDHYTDKSPGSRRWRQDQARQGRANVVVDGGGELSDEDRAAGLHEIEPVAADQLEAINSDLRQRPPTIETLDALAPLDARIMRDEGGRYYDQETGELVPTTVAEEFEELADPVSWLLSEEEARRVRAIASIDILTATIDDANRIAGFERVADIAARNRGIVDGEIISELITNAHRSLTLDAALRERGWDESYIDSNIAEPRPEVVVGEVVSAAQVPAAVPAPPEADPNRQPVGELSPALQALGVRINPDDSPPVPDAPQLEMDPEIPKAADEPETSAHEAERAKAETEDQSQGRISRMGAAIVRASQRAEQAVVNRLPGRLRERYETARGRYSAVVAAAGLIVVGAAVAYIGRDGSFFSSSVDAAQAHVPPPLPKIGAADGATSTGAVSALDFEVPIRNGQTLWSYLQQLGMPKAEVMDQILDATAEYAKAHPDASVKVVGSGTRQWVSINGQSGVREVADLLQPYLSR